MRFGGPADRGWRAALLAVTAVLIGVSCEDEVTIAPQNQNITLGGVAPSVCPDQDAPLVQNIQQFVRVGDEGVFTGGVWYLLLTGISIKIGVAYFHGNAGRQFLGFSQLVGQIRGHNGKVPF